MANDTHASDVTAKARVRWGVGHVPHGRIPDWLLLDPDVSDRAKVLYVVIGRYADDNGRSFPSKAKLGEHLGCSRSTLDSAMKELVERGALVVTARFRSDGSRGSNDYELPWSEMSNPRGGLPDTSGMPPSDVRGGHSLHTNEEHITNEGTPAVGVEIQTSDLSSPAPFTRIDGRNAAFDALAEEGGADPDARGGEIAGALKKIAALVWARLDDDMRAMMWADHERWTLDMAAEIRRRAAMYRRAMSGARCTPTALAKWWWDVEREARSAMEQSLTPAEIAAMPLDEPWR